MTITEGDVKLNGDYERVLLQGDYERVVLPGDYQGWLPKSASTGCLLRVITTITTGSSSSVPASLLGVCHLG